MLCYLHSDLRAANQAQQPVGIQQFIERGKQFRDGGQLHDALAAFRKAYDLAEHSSDQVLEAKSLVLIGSTQTLIFEYGAALESLERAIRLGEKLNDQLVVGSASANVATLYWQLGDISAAEAQSRYAVKCLKIAKAADKGSGTRLARTILIHASLCFELKKNLQGYRDYDEAFAIATQQKDLLLQAMILDKRGISLMHDGSIGDADNAFQQALKLSQNIRDIDGLAFEKVHLAELELQKTQPNCKAGISLIDQAFSLASPAFKTSPRYYPLDIHGRLLLHCGNKSAALTEFGNAVDSANQWRSSALPGDTTNTQTVKQLQNVYSDYAHLAADISLKTNDKALAIKALDVLSENRAASLREQLQRVYGNNGRLPDQYLEKLADLQTAQAAVTLGRNTSEDQARLMQIRLDISKYENNIGIKSEKVRVTTERNPRRNSLRDIQLTLSRDQVLLSISLGKSRSYIWAVTSANVILSELPGEEELTSTALSFAAAVRARHSASAYADRLTRDLFSGLPADVWNRSEWMLVADGALLDGIPFSVLPQLGPGTGKPMIEGKSLRLLPSELLLAERQRPNLTRNFVGVGDPIYNFADSRVARNRAPDAKTLSDGITLARLVGSDLEVRSAARKSNISEAIILTGVKATRHNLTEALARKAGIIHFAVHVVSPPDEPQQAALALSIKSGIPELLTPEAIASLQVPGSLVVLSGCSSGQGQVLPGAGLVGLSRAWLLAGASAVIVSSWPTPDDSGKFFSFFYDHFDQITSGDTAQRAALALRQAQLDMLHGKGYQTSPAFWGAFTVIAKE